MTDELRPSPTYRERQVAAAIIETATRGHVSQAEHDEVLRELVHMRGQRDAATRDANDAVAQLVAMRAERDEALAEVERLKRDVGQLLINESAGIRAVEVVAEQRDAAIARAEREAAHAEQYKADWYAAKQEFGTAMAKVRERERGAIARAERAERLCVEMWDRADDWAGPCPSSHYRSDISDRLRPMRAGVKP